MGKIKRKVNSQIRSEGFFDVIKLFVEDSRLFDCIPDNWFYDENKDSCFWPPTKGKSVSLRALKREKPDVTTWELCQCEVVEEGFATYSCGQALVREKCAQKYNTSSAEEHINDAKFRRQHPALSLSASASFEGVFKKKKPTKSSEEFQGNTSIIDITSKGVNEKTGAVHSEKGVVIDLDGSPLHGENCVATRTEEISPRHNSSGSIRVHQSDVSKGKSSDDDASCSNQFERAANSLHLMKESKTAGISPGKHQSSGSFNSALMDKYESFRHQESATDINRVDLRSSIREFERTRVSRSRSRSQRNRSTSHQSRSSNDSFPRKRQHSGSNKLPSTSRSRSSSRQSDLVNADRRSSSRESTRLSRRNRSLSYESRSSKSNSNSRAGKFQRHSQDECSSSCQSRKVMTQVLLEVRSLTKTVCKDQREKDRRMTRMEVAINKILVRMGDITRSNAAISRNSREYSNDDLHHRRAPSYGESSRQQRRDDFGGTSIRQRPSEGYGDSSRRHRPREDFGDSCRRQRRDDDQNRDDNFRNFVNPRGQRTYAFPILSLNELTGLNQQLMDRNFFTFLIDQEVEFCTPGKNTTNNVVMTSYLKRFISLRVRGLLTLKELQSDCSMTLFSDFHYVYQFLIEVARAGYKSCNKSLTEKEANEALRIVWGRTKQMLNGEQKKRK